MSAKKISHVQGKGSIAHNNRLFTPKNVDTSRTPDNICYVRKSIAEAYSEIFDDAVAEYNAKQKRSDRMIKNGYYEHLFNRSPCSTVVESANGQKSFYEDVVQIGDKDDTGVNSPDAKTAKLCLDEYMKGFQQRNPNFIVFNAVLHMDEATPHLHIDYIPIGHYNRGVPIQNGIAQALKEMGHGSGKDAISRWRKSERDMLKKICISHGLDIAEESPGRGYSMKVEEYKEHQDRIHAYEAELQPLLDAKNIADSVSVTGTKTLFGNNYVVSGNEFSEIDRQKKALAVQQNEVKEMQNHFDKERLNIQSEKEKLIEGQKKLDERNARLKDFENSLYRRDSKITNAENRLMERERACIDLYNSQKHLNENYESVRSAYSELEKELSAANRYKKDSEVLRAKVDRLETRIKSERNEYEEQLRQKENDITAVESELSECKKEISGLKKTIDSLRNYIDKLFEIGAYMAKKFRMDFENIVNRRIDGYSLKYIFGDNERER